MKIHTKLIFLCFLSLSGCSRTCKFLDWNCNQDVGDTAWNRKVDACTITQQEIAKKNMKNLYTKEVGTHIFDQCIIMDGKYKFIDEPGPKYRTP